MKTPIGCSYHPIGAISYITYIVRIHYVSRWLHSSSNKSFIWYMYIYVGVNMYEIASKVFTSLDSKNQCVLKFCSQSTYIIFKTIFTNLLSSSDIVFIYKLCSHNLLDFQNKFVYFLVSSTNSSSHCLQSTNGNGHKHIKGIISSGRKGYSNKSWRRKYSKNCFFFTITKNVFVNDKLVLVVVLIFVLFI